MSETWVSVEIDRNIFDNFTKKLPVLSLSIENFEIFQIRIWNLLLLIVFINNWPMVTIWYQTHLWRTSPRTLFVRLTVRSRFYRRPRSQSFLHVYLCFGKKFEPLVGYMYLMYRQFLETVSRSLSKKMSNLSQRAIKSKTGFLIVEL